MTILHSQENNIDQFNTLTCLFKNKLCLRSMHKYWIIPCFLRTKGLTTPDEWMQSVRPIKNTQVLSFMHLTYRVVNNNFNAKVFILLVVYGNPLVGCSETFCSKETRYDSILVHWSRCIFGTLNCKIKT